MAQSLKVVKRAFLARWSSPHSNIMETVSPDSVSAAASTWVDRLKVAERAFEDDHSSTATPMVLIVMVDT